MSLLVFHHPPQPFGEHVSRHAPRPSMLIAIARSVSILAKGALVNWLRWLVTQISGLPCRIERLGHPAEAEFHLLCYRQPPSEHPSAEPIHHGRRQAGNSTTSLSDFVEPALLREVDSAALTGNIRVNPPRTRRQPLDRCGPPDSALRHAGQQHQRVIMPFNPVGQ